MSLTEKCLTYNFNVHFSSHHAPLRRRMDTVIDYKQSCVHYNPMLNSLPLSRLLSLVCLTPVRACWGGLYWTAQRVRLSSDRVRDFEKSVVNCSEFEISNLISSVILKLIKCVGYAEGLYALVWKVSITKSVINDRPHVSCLDKQPAHDWLSIVRQRMGIYLAIRSYVTTPGTYVRSYVHIECVVSVAQYSLNWPFARFKLFTWGFPPLCF